MRTFGLTIGMALIATTGSGWASTPLPISDSQRISCRTAESLADSSPYVSGYSITAAIDRDGHRLESFSLGQGGPSEPVLCSLDSAASTLTCDSADAEPGIASPDSVELKEVVVHLSETANTYVRGEEIRTYLKKGPDGEWSRQTASTPLFCSGY